MTWLQQRQLYVVINDDDNDEDGEDSFTTTQKIQMDDEPKKLDFSNNFYGGMNFQSQEVHSSLLQFLQDIEK